MKEVDLLLACLEDWQGAYVDGELVSEGHEVNMIDIVKEFKYFKSAEWQYLHFETDEDFNNFLFHFDARLPKNLSELDEWL